MKSRLSLITLVALAVRASALSAEPTVEWATPAGSARHDFARDIVLKPSGEILLAGNFDYDDTTQPETVLHRFDLSGVQVRSQASRGEQIRGVAVDSSYLAKYSATGTLLWERATGSTGTQRRFAFDGGFKVALDAAGNLCVAGVSTGPALFGSVTFPDKPGGPLLCKYTPDGTLLWVKRVEGAGEVFEGTQLGGGDVRSMAMDRDGNIVIDGYLRDGPADFGGTVVNIPGPYGSVFIAKFSAGGEFQWVRTGYGYGGVAADGQGNIYFNQGLADPNVMQCGKFSPAGDLMWQRSIPGAYGNGLTLDGKDEPIFKAGFGGTVLMDGHTVSNTYWGALICKSDANGKFQWAFGATGELNTEVVPVVSDRAGNIYAAGRMYCRYSNGGWICGTGMLGSFSLAQQFEGGDDFFVTKLFDPTAVTVGLKLARVGSDLTLSWPVKATNYVLEAAISLPAISWTTVTNTPTVTATNRSVQLPLTGNATFFRLRQP